MFIRTTILAAAAIVAGFLNVGFGVSPAFAQERETLVVSYADLNLANQAGRDVLDRRISRAVADLCGGSAPIELSRVDLSRDCVSATLAAVQPQREAAFGQRGTVQISQNNFTLRVVRAAN